MNRAMILGFAVSFATPVLAGPPSDRLTIEDVFQLELANDPQISPDGKRVVYVRQFADMMADERRSNLWIVDFDGTDHRPLTTGNFSDSSPRWSPDGTQIAYVSDRDGEPQIYRRWMDSGQTAKLSRLTTAPAGIAWSPGGEWISFTAHVPEELPKVEGMPAPPEGAKWAEPARVIDKLVYRFNGPGYLKPGYTQLFVLPAEGGTPRQISSGNFQHGGTGFRASEAVWTPDGKHLILSANRRPDYELEPLDTDIWEFSVADGAVRQLTNRKGPDHSPQISSDGRRIAYLGFDDRYQGYEVTRLYVMGRDGTGSRVLSEKLDRDVANIRWSGDGSGVYFTSDDQGNTGLHFMTLDGPVQKLTGNVGSSWSAYGGGASISVARNGNFATTYSRPDVPGDIALGSMPNPAMKVVTAVNDDLFAGKKLGEVEEIWYASSK
ncbi:MAG: S9 family peptidase, partial [Vicinamibacteria bacterium]